MSNPIRTPLAALLAVALALVAPAAPARAGTSAAMSQLLDVLRADGTISAEAYAALRAALAADAAEREREVEAAAERASSAVRDEIQREVEDAVGTGRVVQKRNRLYMTEDDGFELTLTGRLHVDSVWYDEDDVELSSGAEVRRVRFDVRGQVWDDWSFFAGLELGAGDIRFRGMSLTYSGFEKLRIQAGQLRQPLGMDDLTSSSYTTFLERANVSDILVPGRDIGLAVSTGGEHWANKSGVFWSGDSDGGDPDGLVDLDGGWAVASRQTFAPWNEHRRVLHFGLAAAYKSGGDLGEARFRARPGSHVTDVRFVDTGTLEGIDRVLHYGAELAASIGPFLFQSEYIGARLERDDGLPTLDFDGYYAQASWFLTGESRPYSQGRGAFGRVVPNRRFDPRGGGAGAWEVALRYSNLDLNSEEIVGGEQDLVTVGVNWYPNPHVRFMFNYARMLDVDRRGTIFDGDRPSSLGLRSQITW